jgi:hypothetical protein
MRIARRLAFALFVLFVCAIAPAWPQQLVQPAGFASIVALQQAVTATAAALPSNSMHGFCVKALPANTLTIYVGPSGVTTSTGYPLAGGDSICYQVANTNLVYVIAASTGSSIAASGN